MKQISDVHTSKEEQTHHLTVDILKDIKSWLRIIYDDCYIRCSKTFQDDEQIIQVEITRSMKMKQRTNKKTRTKSNPGSTTKGSRAHRKSRREHGKGKHGPFESTKKKIGK